MNAVGRLHRIGVSRRIKMARPYPAPCTMSSVPYVPPDTIKKVAATRGHKVSLPNFLFRGRTEMSGLDDRVGALAVANFYGFLLKRLTLTTASPLIVTQLLGYSDSTGMSAKLVRSTENTAI